MMVREPSEEKKIITNCQHQLHNQPSHNQSPKMLSRRLTANILNKRITSIKPISSIICRTIHQSTRILNEQQKPQQPQHHRQVTVDREFPDPFAKKKTNRRYMVVYAIGLTAMLAMIFNYEKTGSPIITSTLYFVRRSKIANERLGEGIDFLNSFPWISGPLNTVRGNIDIVFSVKGDKGTGRLKLKATRESKMNPFDIHHFLLEIKEEDGKLVDYDLLKDPDVQFAL